VAIRATLPGQEFDIPRWHHDGAFFKTPDGEQRKVAVVLKGPATLFNDLQEEFRAAFREASRAKKRDTARERLKIVELIDPARTQTGAVGQGAVFVAGEERGAVHSEPPLDSIRLFVSVLPGTKEQIEDLRQRWERPKTSYAKGPAAQGL
jgi:hypothetical protein